jgi:hypothetical protein
LAPTFASELTDGGELRCQQVRIGMNELQAEPEDGQMGQMERNAWVSGSYVTETGNLVGGEGDGVGSQVVLLVVSV